MTAILVIRHDDKFSSALREAGFDVVNFPLIETRPLDDLSDLRVKIANLSEYDGLFFTSPVAAEIFVKERKDSNGFHGNIYTLGERAKYVLESSGLTIKSAGDANTANELLSGFADKEFEGKRFLFVRGDKSLRTIPEKLKDVATVDEVVVYKTESLEINEEKISDLGSRILGGEIDIACFFSPSAVGRFADLFGDAAPRIRAATIGTTTANAVKQARFELRFVSPISNAEDFARSLIEHVRQVVSLSR